MMEPAKVLCCNACGIEVFVQAPKIQPEQCPNCKADFVHGWDALLSKLDLPSASTAPAGGGAMGRIAALSDAFDAIDALCARVDGHWDNRDNKSADAAIDSDGVVMNAAALAEDQDARLKLGNKYPD